MEKKSLFSHRSLNVACIFSREQTRWYVASHLTFVVFYICLRWTNCLFVCCRYPSARKAFVLLHVWIWALSEKLISFRLLAPVDRYCCCYCCTRRSLLFLHPAVVIWRIAGRRENSRLLWAALSFLLRELASLKSSSSEIRASGRPVSPTASAQGSFLRRQRPRSEWTSGRGWWT